MKITGNIDKLTWTVLDKGISVVFVIVVLKMIMNSMAVSDFGVFQQLVQIHMFIYVIIDSLALQSVIQYGQEKEKIPFVNTVSMALFLIIATLSSIISYLLKDDLAWLMEEERLSTIMDLLPLMIFAMIPRYFSIKFLYRDLEYKKLFFTNLSYFGVITLVVMTIKSNNWSNLSGILEEKMLFDIDYLFYIYFYSALFSSLIGYILTFRKWKFSITKSISLKEILNFNTPVALSSIMYSLPKTLDISIIQYTLKGEMGARVSGLYYGAKIFMRGFEDLTAAIYGIIYPLSRKYIARGETENAKIMITKAISYMILMFSFSVIMLYTGLFDNFLFGILPAEYKIQSNLIDVITSLKILAIGGLALPFTTLTGILYADNKPKIVTIFVAISVVLSLSTFYIMGYLEYTQLIPLGLVLFYLSLSFSYLIYCSKNYEIKFKDFFRAFPDIMHFIKNKIRL